MVMLEKRGREEIRERSNDAAHSVGWRSTENRMQRVAKWRSKLYMLGCGDGGRYRGPEENTRDGGHGGKHGDLVGCFASSPSPSPSNALSALGIQLRKHGAAIANVGRRQTEASDAIC